MLVVLIVLGVVAVVAVAAAVVARRRLSAAQAALAAETSERTAADERAVAATEGSTAAEERARLADERATAFEAAREQAEREAEEAAAAQREAEQRALTAEQEAERQTAEAAAVAEAAAAAVAAAAAAVAGSDPTLPGERIDPDVLWALERSRSERTWRLSVAPGPDAASVFTDASDPLVEALQVELDAAREEVGAVVELEVDLPDGVTAAGSVLTLRAAQELLATVVRRGEVTTLSVHAEGRDVLVVVRSVDEFDEPIEAWPLAIPPSAGIEAIESGVRIRNAIAAPPPDDDATAPDD